MNNKRLRVIFALCTLAIMVLIFCFSAQNADESSDTSDPITEFICSVFYEDFDSLSKATRIEILENISFFVRKTAHFSVYFLLGASSFLTVLTFRKITAFLRPLLSLTFCALYAFSDEIHQFYVPGRSCELRDVLIDVSGALLSTAIIMLYLRFSAKLKKG